MDDYPLNKYKEIKRDPTLWLKNRVGCGWRTTFDSTYFCGNQKSLSFLITNTIKKKREGVKGDSFTNTMKQAGNAAVMAADEYRNDLAVFMILVRGVDLGFSSTSTTETNSTPKVLKTLKGSYLSLNLFLRESPKISTFFTYNRRYLWKLWFLHLHYLRHAFSTSTHMRHILFRCLITWKTINQEIIQ